MGEEEKGMEGTPPRWRKLAGRSRGAGLGGKGRKSQALEHTNDAAKCKENACIITPKRGFWRNRCMKVLAASDTSANIAARPHPKGKISPEVGVPEENRTALHGNTLQEQLHLDRQIDEYQSAVNKQCKVQGDNGKHSTDCLEDVNQSVHNTELRAEDGVLRVESMEWSKISSGTAGSESGWQDALAVDRDSRATDAVKTDCIEAPRHENSEDEGLIGVDANDEAGKEVSLQSAVATSIFGGDRDDEMSEVDRAVCDTEALKIHDPSARDMDEGSVMKALVASQRPSAPPNLVPEDSLSSCLSSSFLSCCSHLQEFVSCSSLSISKILEDTEFHSFSSSSSPSQPKQPLNAESQSFSSSSNSTAHSSSTPDHLREGRIHSFPSTPNSTRSSSYWEQGLCSSPEIKANQSVLSERSEGCSRCGMSDDSYSFAGRHPGYTMSRIKSLVYDLQSDHTDIQLSAAAELRLLAKHDDKNRILIARVGACKPLIGLLHSTDESIQLEATTALLNLSLSHVLKEYIVREGAIEALVGVLSYGLGVVVKENAAVALAHLAVCEANRSKIGAAGAIPPLIDLLERGSPRGKKDAAAALYRVSSIDENRRRMIRAGALRLLVGFMSAEGDKEGMVDKAMAILVNLVNIEQGRVAFFDEGGVVPLLQVIKVGSQRSRGFAIPILLQLCTHSSKHRSLVLQKEPLPTLMSIGKAANSRVKSQIAEIIEALIVDA